MAVAFVNDQGTFNGSTSSKVCNLPGSLVVDNILVAIASCFHGGRTLSLSGGWTAIRSGDGPNSLHSWYRVIDGSEGASVTLTVTGGSSPVSVWIGQYSGGDPSDVVGAANSYASGGSGTTLTGTSIDTDTDDAMLIQYCGTGGNRTFTAGSSQTERFDGITFGGGTGPSLGVYDQTQASAGSSGSKVVNSSVTSTWGTALFSLNAAPTGGDPIEGESIGESTAAAGIQDEHAIGGIASSASATTGAIEAAAAEVAGTSASASTGTGAIEAAAEVAGSSAGASTGTAGIVEPHTIAGTSAGASSASGGIGPSATPIAGTSHGRSDGTGAADIERLIIGYSIGTSTASAAIGLAVDVWDMTGDLAIDTEWIGAAGVIPEYTGPATTDPEWDGLVRIT